LFTAHFSFNLRAVYSRLALAHNGAASGSQRASCRVLAKAAPALRRRNDFDEV
jgi:hypothetical protein